MDMTRRRWMIVFGLVAAIGWGGVHAAAEVSVGKPASEFTLVDSDGQMRSLSEFNGKLVVLEWFNHDCPFVRKHYGSGQMQRLQRRYTEQGVVWLSINSSAPGQQGALTPEEARRLTQEKDAAPTAVLLDSDGMVGRLYGAKTTPHMFIISPEGFVIYAGAIDDTPSTDQADIPGAANYVQQALDEALAGKAVSIPSTTSYGCSVKYTKTDTPASWIQGLFR